MDWIVEKLIGLGMTMIIEGEADGADALARDCGVAHRLPHRPYPANWKKYGKKAGGIRNQQMLDEGHPVLVVAFAGGTGTADMIRRAKKAKITTWVL